MMNWSKEEIIILGWESHTCISGGVKIRILEAVGQGSYEKAGQSVYCGEDRVSRETVMRKVRSMETPLKGHKETDKDHIALQYKEKKGISNDFRVMRTMVKS